jgi:hypothetical protein
MFKHPNQRDMFLSIRRENGLIDGSHNHFSFGVRHHANHIQIGALMITSNTNLIQEIFSFYLKLSANANANIELITVDSLIQIFIEPRCGEC